jgi:DNA-binding PadR family transcriptional regulator
MIESITGAELMILSTIVRLGENAYGVPIVQELERHGRRVGVATVYVALGRLETKGMVTSETGDSTPERGGRAKRYFQVTAKGIREIRAMQRTLDRLWQGVPRLQRGTR